MNMICRNSADSRTVSKRIARRSIIAGVYLPCGILLAMAVVIAGCSKGDRPELAEVEGTVTLDGQPLAQATVVFQPAAEGRASRGMTDESGKYRMVYLREIMGAKLGPHEVEITTATETNPQERVPAKYNHETTLAAEVQPGTNQFNFDLATE